VSIIKTKIEKMSTKRIKTELKYYKQVRDKWDSIPDNPKSVASTVIKIFERVLKEREKDNDCK